MVIGGSFEPFPARLGFGVGRRLRSVVQADCYSEERRTGRSYPLSARAQFLLHLLASPRIRPASGPHRHVNEGRCDGSLTRAIWSKISDGVDGQDIIMWGEVTSADTVAVHLFNSTNSTLRHAHRGVRKRHTTLIAGRKQSLVWYSPRPVEKVMSLTIAARAMPFERDQSLGDQTHAIGV